MIFGWERKERENLKEALSPFVIVNMDYL